MEKLIQLNLLNSKLILNEKLYSLKKKLEESKLAFKSISNNYFKFFSKEIQEPGIQLFLEAYKGDERIEFVRNHLDKVLVTIMLNLQDGYV